MAIEVAMNTPLADALNMAIQPKLVEVGWASGGADDQALSEYIILMLVNGKTQDQIASELAGDLLSLGPDDPGARDFAKWLFEQIEFINAQLNGVPTQFGNAGDGAGQSAPGMFADQDTEMSTVPDSVELNAPTGPRSMRNAGPRGNREKRMLGHMTKAMDRSQDNVLHRVRANGNERINSHRTPPTGPRGGFGRGNNRGANNRAAGFTAYAGHLDQVANVPPMHGQHGMNMNEMNWAMVPGQQEQLFNLLQHQSQMMQQLQEQLNQQNRGGHNGRNQSRSLFDRVQNPRGGRGRGGFANGHQKSHHAEPTNPNEAGAEGEDEEMGQARREQPNPEMTMCKFNLACTNKDCKFAHQSPAAPPNTAIDFNDVCSYGVACKNRKCVGRHPSPATKRAHQDEQVCKFFPNCTNPACPFKHPKQQCKFFPNCMNPNCNFMHPEAPPCRNGGDCTVEGCKFTHVKVMCKFNPCKNQFCPYKHEEGQRAIHPDGAKEHVSDRKFVDSNGAEELVVPGGEPAVQQEQEPVAMDEGIA
ncbi:hypothetical protein F4818DRAFT_420943 [Hypoxylon cercidicola]|nr:hypothetical protein F4818DRAFT_420943 [Hypoxylon cercidicola]